MKPRSFRMIKQHPRAGITHHRAHPLLHLLFITMNRALPASRFLLAERTTAQAGVGIFQQFRTRRAEPGIPLLLPAIQPDHQLDNLLFFFDS